MALLGRSSASRAAAIGNSWLYFDEVKKKIFEPFGLDGLTI